MRSDLDQDIPDLGELRLTLPSFTTKQDYVAALVREAIVSGKLSPGRRLRQEEVSRQLGLSWTPVREAFRQLEAEGWLIIEPHRGAVVAPLSLADFEEIYLLRLANEPLLARHSAERMDESTLVRIEDSFQRMQRLDPRDAADWQRFLQLEREFHTVQYQAAGLPRLFEVVMGLRDAAERYLRASIAFADEPRHHQRTHVETLAACRARDGGAAEAAIRRGLERVLARMRPELRRLLEGERNGAP